MKEATQAAGGEGGVRTGEGDKCQHSTVTRNESGSNVSSIRERNLCV